MTLQRFATENILFVFYSCIFFILFTGVALAGSTRYLGYLALYFVFFVVFYFIFRRAIRTITEKIRSRVCLNFKVFNKHVNYDMLMALILGLGTAFMVFHFSYLEGIPVLTSAEIDNYYAIMHVRQDIFLDAPILYRYIPNFLVKSILPFSILYFFYNKCFKSMLVVMLLGSFYALALMNKIFILLIFLPLAVYCIATFRWRIIPLVVAIPAVGIALLIFVQNPQIRPDAWQHYTAELKHSSKYIELTTKINRIMTRNKSKGSTFTSNDWMKATAKQSKNPVYDCFNTVYIRIFLVPGEVISAWFKHIPSSIPFAGGNGYRLVAWLNNSEFTYYPSLVHDLENPLLVEKGVRGTMTAASFMEDYANFGWKGLVFSGLLFSFILAIVTQIFSSSWKLSLAINSVPIGLIAESPLTTVLLTGGWILSVLLYCTFKKGMT